MKSFDKFCEAMVNPEENKGREIFDERQKQLQLHLAIRAMAVFIVLMFLHTVISECIYKWSDSDLMPMLLFVMLSLLFYIISAEVKGCFIGVSGSAARYVPGFLCIIIGFMNGLGEFLRFADSGFAIISNGMVVKQFTVLLCYVLLITAGILTVIFIGRERKNKNEHEIF